MDRQLNLARYDLAWRARSGIDRMQETLYVQKAMAYLKALEDRCACSHFAEGILTMTSAGIYQGVFGKLTLQSLSVVTDWILSGTSSMA